MCEEELEFGTKIRDKGDGARGLVLLHDLIDKRPEFEFLVAYEGDSYTVWRRRDTFILGWAE